MQTCKSEEILLGKMRCCQTGISSIVMTTEANGPDQAGVGDCYAASRVAPSTINRTPTALNPAVPSAVPLPSSCFISTVLCNVICSSFPLSDFLPGCGQMVMIDSKQSTADPTQATTAGIPASVQSASFQVSCFVFIHHLRKN